MRPAARRRSDDFAFARTLARPTARFEILLEYLDRRSIVPLFAALGLAQGFASGFGFAARFAPLGGPATLASSAAIRLFNIS
ncbi:MAG: hypothetical protein M3438_07085, partial [Pseudomonadota bacterium]|nr:hypothetical protein [Pseudomonadota bacterium]